MGSAACALEGYDGALDESWRPAVKYLTRPKLTVGADHFDRGRAAEELRIRAVALNALWIRRAYNSFPTFMEYAFVDYAKSVNFEQQWFHDEWSAGMDKYSRLLIIAPRNHGKTTQIVGRAIWELGRDSNLRIKIVCASDGRAKERLFQIVQNIEYNPRIREVFPGLVPDASAPWNAHKIHVVRTALHKDASIEAVGITSTATGGRADILIPDDAVDRRNALSFPALRSQIKQSWLSDWTNLLDPGSRVWGICTLWHKDDLNHMLRENPAYKVLFYAINEVFGSIWPSKWPEAALRERYHEIKSVEFNRGFRNRVIDEETQMVPPTWFQYRDLTKDDVFQRRVKDMFFFNSYDTAGAPTGKADQDYSSSVVIAVDPEPGMVYVMDGWRVRATLKKMAGLVDREAAAYHPFRIVIEKVGQSSLDEWVANDFPKLAPIIETAKPAVKKAIRLLAVTPLMESGKVIFSHHLDPEREEWDPSRGCLVHELQDFPFAKHDDMVDAFSQALYWARRYFLDAWAPGGDNEDHGVFDESEEPTYLFY